MKPVTWQAMFAAMIVGPCLFACTPAPHDLNEPALPTETMQEWNRTPQIDQVRRDDGDLVFSGVAESEARVVLRNNAGAAFAAVADNEGRFDIRMAAPRGDLWLRPETQVGQTAGVSPDLLVIIAGGQGPILLLRPGAATRRLDSTPVLGAIDSDGRIRRLSGRVGEETRELVIAVDGVPLTVLPDSDGRWNAVTTPEAAFHTVTVGGETFSWPGDGARSAERAVERAGSGWRIHWPLDGGYQTVWAPDVRQATP